MHPALELALLSSRHAREASGEPTGGRARLPRIDMPSCWKPPEAPPPARSSDMPAAEGWKIPSVSVQACHSHRIILLGHFLTICQGMSYETMNVLRMFSVWTDSPQRGTIGRKPARRALRAADDTEGARISLSCPSDEGGSPPLGDDPAAETSLAGVFREGPVCPKMSVALDQEAQRAAQGLDF